jgi:hypothetical protein
LAADLGGRAFYHDDDDARIGTEFAGGPTAITFVGTGGATPSQKGEQVVSLTVKQEDDVTRLVRRSALWPGPRTRLEEVTPGDPVILLEGKVLIAFTFGHVCALAAPSARSDVCASRSSLSK